MLILNRADLSESSSCGCTQTLKTMSRRTSLLDFPNELLHAVKDMIDPHDLLSNVCYFDLCDRTAACFDGENTSFWLRMCRANGLGKRNKDAESPSAFRSWKNVALQCARHAWVCDHPACGRARLEENRAHTDIPDYCGL